MDAREQISRGEAETEAIGAELAAGLSGGTVLALHGDLGAGKTVMARGLARGLGVEGPISSPTFAIIQEYAGRRWRLYHMDMYRIQGEDDALAFGIDEYLEDAQAICIIEWAERIGTLLPAATVHIRLAHRDGLRSIRIEG